MPSVIFIAGEEYLREYHPCNVVSVFDILWKDIY